MTPVRAPAVIRGTDYRELPRCMPVLDVRPAADFHGHPATRRGVYVGNNSAKADEGLVVWTHHAKERAEWPTYIGNLVVDWTDPAALYLSIHWLADRGHLCGWMLPATHGGRVEAWDGLTAWEVSAILISSEVALRAAGRPWITGIARAYGIPTNARMSMDRIGRADVYWTATEADRDYFVAPCRIGHDSRATPDHPGWLYTPRLGLTSYGPEVGAEAVAKINECALADGCCLQVPGGLVVPV